MQTDRPRTRHQLDRHDAVAAETEERVVESDTGLTEQVGDQVGDRTFLVGGRRTERHGLSTEIRFRQCFSVDLSTGTEGHLREFDDRVGNHVLGYPGSHGVHQLRGVDTAAHHVRNQTLTMGTAVHHDHGLANRIVSQHSGFDLAELDPEATDLDLEVATAHVLQRPVGRPAHEIPGPVHDRTVRAEHAGNKTFGGQVRTTEVPAGDLRAGQVQLTDRTDHTGPQPAVEHPRPAVPHRAADRHGVHRLGVDRRIRRVDSEFCWAVQIFDLHTGQRLV